MTITNGQLANADDVNKIVVGNILALANSQKVGKIGDTYLAGKDYLVDGFGSSTMADTSTILLFNTNLPTNLDVHTEKAYVCKVNTNLVGANTSSTLGTLEFYELGVDSEFIIRLGHTTTGGSGVSLEISNGSNHVTIQSWATNESDIRTLKVKLDYSGKNAYVSTDGGATFGGAIDISSVTTHWHLRLNVPGGGETITVYFVGYIDGSTDTVDYVSANKTMSATKSTGFLTWETNSSSTIAGYLSANSGSNYTSFTKDTWTTIANTGTVAKIKLTCSLPGAIEATNATDYIKDVKMVGAYFQ
jgi:hypothetical protein